MVLENVEWTYKVNILKVRCDCEYVFMWQSNISLVECPMCNRKEWWHEDGLDYPGGEKYKVMINKIK